MDWIKELKIGDNVFQIERHPTMPNGEWKWNAIVTKIESNYIETTFERDRNLEWLQELVKKLSPIHRTYQRNWIKNYDGTDGTINIERWQENFV